MSPEITTRPTLTPKEMQVMLDLHDGLWAKAIAARMLVTDHVIYGVVRSVKTKLCLPTVAEIVVWTERNLAELKKRVKHGVSMNLEIITRPTLTPEELRVMVEIHAGRKPKQISKALGITAERAHSHLYYIKLKLCLNSTAEVIVWTERNLQEILKCLNEPSMTTPANATART
jgi:DNA-binding NarL/FixJ family response regulator